MDAVTEIVAYLLQTLLSLYLMAMLLRFLLQWARADFYNPISQFLVKITNPLVIPLRRFIPGLAGLDMATLLVLLLLQMAGISAMLLLNGIAPPILMLVPWALIGLASLVVNFYFFALLAIIIVSWVAPGTRHPAAVLLRQLTEPVMTPFRKLLPSMGGLDLSPILLFILINILQITLRHAATAVGLHPALVIGL